MIAFVPPRLNVESELPPLIVRVFASVSLVNVAAPCVRVPVAEAPIVTSISSTFEIEATLAAPVYDNLTVSVPAPPLIT